jgi:Anti-sigma factor NepR
MTMGEEATEVQGALALASAPSGTGGSGRRPPDPKLKRSTMIRLGQVLRSEYASVIQEPIPEALLALLSMESDEKQPSSKSDTWYL